MAEKLTLVNSEIGQFTEHLRVVADTLKHSGVEYSLVGGLAVRATLGECVEPKRPNGTLIDFDAVALGPDRDTIQTTLEALKKQRMGNPLFPEMGIEPIRFGDKKGRHGIATVLSGMRRDSRNRYYLTYRGIEVQVPRETMELRTRHINGVPFPCFSAKTLLYRYLTRGGIAKEKDMAKLERLQTHIALHENEEPPDHLYRPYLEFAEQIRERYPVPVGLYDAYWNIDRSLNGKISGSTGLIYSLIDRFRAE